MVYLYIYKNVNILRLSDAKTNVRTKINAVCLAERTTGPKNTVSEDVC